ncbi:hypothetical protein LINPERPRIM_LOCUS35119, partial [Linum perenne]
IFLSPAAKSPQTPPTVHATQRKTQFTPPPADCNRSNIQSTSLKKEETIKWGAKLRAGLIDGGATRRRIG